MTLHDREFLILGSADMYWASMIDDETCVPSLLLLSQVANFLSRKVFRISFSAFSRLFLISFSALDSAKEALACTTFSPTRWAVEPHHLADHVFALI